MTSRSASILVAALTLAAAGGLIATARTAPRPPDTSAIRALARELDARLREAAAGATSRAQTLADLPRLAVAVATDAETVRDLTGEELAFRPRDDETIEIAQVPRQGGAPTTLLRIPTGAVVELPLERAGVHLIELGGTLRVGSVVHIEPRERADELYGVVAVSWLADVRPMNAQLDRLGGARLSTAAGTINLGQPLGDDQPTISVPLDSPVAPGASLEAPAPPSDPGGWNAPLLGGAGALAAIGLIAAALMWRRRPPAIARALENIPAVTELRGSSRDALPAEFQFGRYSVIRRLGSGGMADVYLARAEGEAGFERLVALKVMHDDMVTDPNFVSHFLDEARLASKLSHPNIISITDLGKEADKYVIAMEYIDGSDLERLIHNAAERRGPPPVRVAFAIARRICDGLHFAHTATDERGELLHVVHRDVKSANVFVAKTGAVKIGDFGIAKIAGARRSAKTEIGQVKGTAAYMAPEQRLGEEVDLRADVYAVGAVCYELFTGQVINLDLAMLAHLGRVGWPHLDAPSELRPELPKELDDVIFRAMKFEREDRYGSCDELERALAEIADRHGQSASDKVIAEWVAGELAV